MFQYDYNPKEVIDEATHTRIKIPSKTIVYNYSLKAVMLFEQYTGESFVVSATNSKYIPVIVASMDISNNTVVDVQKMVTNKDFIIMLKIESQIQHKNGLIMSIYQDITTKQTAGPTMPQFKSKRELAEESQSDNRSSFEEMAVNLSLIGFNVTDVLNWHMSQIYALFAAKTYANMHQESNSKEPATYTDERLIELNNEKRDAFLKAKAEEDDKQN